MKVCLVNPKSITKSSLSIPHGLLQICAELKKNGYDCKILDFNDSDAKISYDYLKNFDVVGLSVMTTQLKHAIDIANSLNGHTKVVWGGAHCLLDPLSIINRYKNHFVVSGDGERSLLKLLDYFKGKNSFDYISSQAGICCYMDKPIINSPSFIEDLDKLENINYYDLPNFERYLYDPYSYFKKPHRINTLKVLTARGCSWDCSFCINSIYRRYKAFHRSKSINKIREETETVIDDFNVKIIILQDEDFFINKELVEQWQRYAREKGFFWGGDCRYNYFKENMINLGKLKDLVNAGLFFVGMSIEAGSEELRNKLLNKQLKDSEIYNTVKIIRDAVGKRLLINTSFIINYPGDTEINKIKIIKWMDYLSKNLNIGFSGPQIYRSYPGSKLYYLGKDNKEGDIDYYLRNITEVGTLKTTNLFIFFESIFYSNLLLRYFNSKFKFLELRADKDKIDRKILSTEKWKIENFIISIIFLPIKVRLKLDNWRLFFEPFLTGLLFYPLQKIKKLIKLTKRL